MIVRLLDGAIAGIEWLKRAYVMTRIRVQHGCSRWTTQQGHPNARIYARPEFSERLLNHWGEATVWNEVKLLVAPCRGRGLDIACGTGEVIRQLGAFEHCAIWGCDMVDVLIARARQKGILEERLAVCDASELPYSDRFFDFAYSVGSFHCMQSEAVIIAALKESRRVTKQAFFFQVATSRRNRDEGLIRSHQYFFNNSVGWWQGRCADVYEHVFVCDSQWQDAVSVGKWFLCFPAPSLP